MSNGCEGCYSTQKAIEQALTTIRKKAKDYAIEHETNVYIYQVMPGEFAFMEEAAAKQNGIIPTHGILSHIRQTSSG